MPRRFPFSPFSLCRLIILFAATVVRTSASSWEFPMEPAYSVRVEPSFADQCLPIVHPLQVEVENRTASPATWDLLVTISPQLYRGPDSSLQMHFQYTCPAYREVTFPLLLPISMEIEHGVNLSFVLQGPGVVDARQSMFLRLQEHELLPYSLLSQSLAGETIRQLGKTHDDPLFLAVDEFYSDWQSYLGVVSIYLTTSDWLTIASAPRQALLDWTEAGGELIFCHLENVSTPASPVHPNDFPFLPLAGSFPEGRMVHPHGLGQIVWQQPPTATKAVVSPGRPLFATPARIRLPILPDFEEFGDDLPEAYAITGRRVHQGLLLFLVILFGLLVAPLNLWWLARGPKRLRILWTTPILALSFSLLLFGIFHLQNGTGGRGLQVEVIWKKSGSPQLLRVVRQHSETHLLTRKSFTVPDGAWITTQDFSIDENFSRLNSSGQRFWRGNRLDGDWFHSRSRQSQSIVWQETNRQELSVRARRSDTGQIEWEAHSAWPEDCRSLLFRDNSGQTWVAHHLSAGQRLTMEKASEEDLRIFRERLARCGRFASLLRQQWENGRFLAEIVPSPGSALETLPDLDWTVQARYFIGLPQP